METLCLSVELDRRRARTMARLDRLRIYELCMIYINARLERRSISLHNGIAYATNLLKKYLD